MYNDYYLIHEMKRVFFIIVSAIAVVFTFRLSTAKAYEIQAKKPVFDDYIPLLEQAGYFVNSFDIKSLSDSKYSLQFACREYERDSLISKNVMIYPFMVTNMHMVADFPEVDQKDMKPDEHYDNARGIHSCAEKMVIGTYLKNDSTAVVVIDVDNIATSTTQLAFRPLHDFQSCKEFYLYQPRPFKVGEIQFNTFIPLLFYGSAWLDVHYGIIRFCGESVLNPQMTDRLIKDVPHSYVIGVTIKKIDK